MARISVVLPVRNGEATIEAAIDSVLVQSYGDFNLVVVDDGSTDKTMAIIDKIKAKDPRITCFKGEARGGALARNLGIAQSDSEYIAAMDADDISLPDRLAQQVAALENDPSLVVVGSHIVWFGDKTGRPHMLTSKNQCRTALKLFSPLCHPSILMRREAFYAAGQYADQRLLAEDYDLFCRLSFIGELANIPQPLLAYNIHKKQSSQKDKKPQTRDMWETLLRYHQQLLGASEINKARLFGRLIKTACLLGPKHAVQSLRALRDCSKVLLKT